ncbi:MAG: HAMP domain-containing histidine kinase [Ignavibacteriaceae bacterium]|nr:HAMP domain-containing histidine kinase [Ignavibacteriaceae bacterium]
MSDSKLTTKFASPERTLSEELKHQINLLKIHPEITKTLDKLPEFVLVLNNNREIVYANTSLLKYLSINDNFLTESIRLGEALHCEHAFANESGCGTSEYCKNCGAVLAMLSALDGKDDDRECKITQSDSCGALDLRVTSTPIDVDGERMIFFTVRDISNEKRRKVLERIFFHDILNTAGGLLGYSTLLREADQTELEMFVERLEFLSQRLIDEIQAQKQLTAAENGDLKAEFIELDSFSIISHIEVIYKNHEVSHNKEILIDIDSPKVKFKSDKNLLFRVIGNMVKNALEASKEEMAVAIGCNDLGANVQFWVNNRTFIPPNTQLQIFSRSFSTKGAGRGLGTYSMKLLTEKYLQGEINFVSNVDDGTTFYLKLVKEPQI